jgi:GAF domain-containing protein
MTADAAAVAAALTEAAKVINSPRSLSETLDAIVRAAKETVPGFEHIGISTIDRGGRIETQAATDQLVWDLDGLQYGLDEGPCVSSIRGNGSVVVAANIRHDQRWPRFVSQAVQHGLRSQLALQLRDGKETLGGLNLYSTASDDVTADAVHVAGLFATHASIALGRSRYEHQLNDAISTRKVIGQAIGIVMERYGINEDRAFHFLARASSTSNVKLRDIAQEIVAATEEKFAAGEPPPRDADGRP